MKVRAALLVFAMTGVPMFGQSDAPLEASALQAAVSSIDANLRQFAGSDEPGGRKLTFRDAIISQGPSAIPILAGLFNSKEDSDYRSAILGILVKIDGGKEEAIRLIRSKLEKPPELWGERSWVFHSLWLLREVDEPEARWAALRVLSKTEERHLLLPAVEIFNHIGTRGDVEPLTALAAQWEAEPNQSDLHRVGAGWIRSAIEKINTRTAGRTDVRPTLTGNTSAIAEQKPRGDASARAPTSTPVNEMNKPAATTSSRWWIAAGLLTLLLCAWRISKSLKHRGKAAADKP